MPVTPLTPEAFENFHKHYEQHFELPVQSELLTQFYRSYAAWLDDEAPKRVIFLRDRGLCGNLQAWTRAIGLSGTPLKALRNEMARQFEAVHLNPDYPFSLFIEYEAEKTAERCHQNLKRIEWVMNHAR